jgi:hypothetical protein
MAALPPLLPLGTVRRDRDTAPFLDGAARGEFLLRRCRHCANIGGPQEAQCPACGSVAAEWIPAAGTARVISWSAVHGRAADGQTEPQNITVIAEFDEGPWWWSQIVDADPAEVETGRRIRVSFAPAEGGEILPVFQLDQGDGDGIS